jgi:hypothetical protein
MTDNIISTPEGRRFGLHLHPTIVRYEPPVGLGSVATPRSIDLHSSPREGGRTWP